MGSSHSTMYQGSAVDLGVVVTYRRRVSPGFNEDNIEGVEMSILRSPSTLCVSSV
jgi:hypothetical protein